MRRRRFVHTVGGLGAVGLGGCLRLTSSDGTETATGTTSAEDESTAAATTTAEPTTTEEPTTEDDGEPSYPAGLDDEGVYAYLVDSHVNTLVGTGFVENWTAANQTLGKTRERLTATVQDGSAIMERGIGTDLQIYYDADGGYWQEGSGDDATYGEDRRAFEFPWVSKSRELRGMFLAGAWDAPTPVEDGFEIAASGTDELAALKREFEAAEVERFDAEGFVTAEGVVTELTVEFEFLHAEADRLFQIRVRHGVEAIGETNVVEPSWLATAKERAPEVAVSVTDDNYIRFEHRSGNPIRRGTNVSLYDNENRQGWGDGSTDDPFEPGSTVYFWMENGRLRWNRGSRPARANPQSLDRRLAFWMSRHGAEYFGAVELGG